MFNEFVGLLMPNIRLVIFFFRKENFPRIAFGKISFKKCLRPLLYKQIPPEQQRA